MGTASRTTSFALRKAQRRVLKQVLSAPVTTNWQIVLVDPFSNALLKALFSQSELRNLAVTLLTPVEAATQAVPDAPALYVLTPTPENIAHLAHHLTPPARFHHARLAFVSAAPSALLVALAAQLPVPSPVTSCLDLYSHFISLDHNLFTLHMPRSYPRLALSHSDQPPSHILDRIVSGIFSVLVTLAVVPIIRAQPGAAAEAVAVRLDAKLRSSLSLFQSASLPNRALSFRRPLLLLLDRHIDFLAMFHHTWTYQALVHDCLNMHLHTVKLPPSKDANTSKVEYVLDKDRDSFWRQNASAPFPTVAESIEESLSEYRASVDHINQKASSDTPSQSSLRTDHLANAISSLPELSKRKQNIDIHTNIATALLHNINRRSLDTFFELESRIFAERTSVSSLAAQQYKLPMLQLLKGVRETAAGEKRGQGTSNDRLRLFLIYYTVFGSHLSESDVQEFRSVLDDEGVDTSLVHYIQRKHGFRHDLVSNASTLARGSINAARLRGLMTNVVNRGYRSFANVAQNAKKLITDHNDSFPVANTLHMFMSEHARARNEALASEVLDGYLLFDPKLMPSGDNIIQQNGNATYSDQEKRLSATNSHRMVFSDAIVFVIGGGNYVEYDNCMESLGSTSNSTSSKNILYGTTELMTAEGFLDQLTTIAGRHGT